MKGAVLTQISAWWFRQLEGVVPHHMISADADEIIRKVPALKDHRADIVGRAMLCRRTTVFPIECVIRGYISGSAWKEYAAARHAGRREARSPAWSKAQSSSPRSSARPPRPRPATTKTSRSRGCARSSATTWRDKLESMARAVYTFGEKIAREQGIIIADTKFEFGRDAGRPHHPDRRGDDAGQFAVLGGRCLQARPAAAEFRQAAAARLSRQPSAAPAAGTATPRRRRCRPAWWTRRASAISKPIGA